MSVLRSFVKLEVFLLSFKKFDGIVSILVFPKSTMICLKHKVAYFHKRLLLFIFLMRRGKDVAGVAALGVIRIWHQLRTEVSVIMTSLICYT